MLHRTPLSGLGEAIIQAERSAGVHALFLVSAAVWESGAFALAWWDRNKADRERFSIFGWHSSPPLAGFADGVMKTARHYADEYLNPKGECWGGAPTLRGISVEWISDRVEAEGERDRAAKRERWIQAILDTARMLLERGGTG